MNLIASIFETPLALGSTVLIPVLLFVICLLVRVRPMIALRTSFSVGFSMVGISILIARFGQMLTDIATLIVENSGSTVQVADAGRKAAMIISGASQIGVYIMPLAIAINLVMLLTRSTHTINIDLWTFWLFAFAGAMAQSLTGSLGYGLMVAAATVVFTLVMADSSVKGVEKCCAMHGVTFTNPMTAAFGPIAGAVYTISEKLPYKGRKDITFGWLQKRIGYLGDPCLIGTVLMAIFGMMNDMVPAVALQAAVQVGAYIFIVPKIMLLLGDSLRPLATGLDEVSKTRFKLHSNLTIGLSSGVGLGNPTSMLLSVVMVPVTIWLARVLPGNQFMPSVDFAMLPYMLIMVVAICRGGLLRSVISSVLSIIAMLYSSSMMAGLFTQASLAADPTTYATTGAISSMYAAGSPVTGILTWVSSFGIAGMGLLVLIILAMAIWNYNRLTGNVKIYVKKQKAMRTFAIDNIREEAERRRELRSTAVSKKREDLRRAVEVDRLARGEGIDTAPDESEQMTIFAEQEPQEKKLPEATETEAPTAPTKTEE